MNKHFILLLLITFIIGNCAPTPASSTPLITVAVTQTILPSQTPRPTQIMIPSDTPYPPLQTEGPYLLFTNNDNFFTIMDADGSGRKYFQLPNDGYIWTMEKAVSPNNKWLAYFTGANSEQYDLAIHILNLENEQTNSISRLFAQEYSQNLESALNDLQFDLCADSMKCKMAAFNLSLIEGIHSLTWSPDSKHLAFVSQMDGPSSDIYIYSIEDKSIRHLTNEPDNIYRIEWSPKGDNILYSTSIEEVGLYLKTKWRIANLTSSTPQNPHPIGENSFGRSIGWAGENLYFLSNAAEAPVYANIWYIDTTSEVIKEIWPTTAESIALDSQNDQFFLSFYPYKTNTPDSELTAGIYLLSFDGSHRKISDEIYIFFDEQNFSESYFAVGKSGLVRISSDGDITYVAKNTPKINTVSTSPNNKWTLVAREKILELFSESLKLSHSWDMNFNKLAWNPTSTGAFLNWKGNLYYLSIPHGEPALIDTCTTQDCFFNYIWLP